MRFLLFLIICIITCIDSFTQQECIFIDVGNGSLQKSFFISDIDSITFEIRATVPVELTSFRAEVVDGRVNLVWQTITENNNSGFCIERRNSKEKSWSKIGFVPGQGNSTIPITYCFIDQSFLTGLINYRLKQIDFNGTWVYSDEIDIEINSNPDIFMLYQNYPNPFNPSTKIKYSILTEGDISLTIFNSIGENILRIKKYVTPGIYEFDLTVSNLTTRLSSGIYFYRLEANGFSSTKKMIYLK